MKIMARRKLLYGVLYSAGDVFECGDVEQVRAWVATGAVGLMGAELPERVETQAQAMFRHLDRIGGLRLLGD